MLMCIIVIHLIQQTVTGGMQPDFNTTSQNVVNVDDFFLKFLQTETASIYLYSCNGVEFRLRFTFCIR